MTRSRCAEIKHFDWPLKVTGLVLTNQTPLFVNTPRSDTSMKKLVKLPYACLKHFDWLKNIEWPIRAIQNTGAGNFFIDSSQDVLIKSSPNVFQNLTKKYQQPFFLQKGCFLNCPSRKSPNICPTFPTKFVTTNVNNRPIWSHCVRHRSYLTLPDI